MEVSCTFWHPSTGLDQVSIAPHTGLGGTTSALRDRCLNHSVTNGYPMWAMPDVGRGDDSWLVYSRTYSDSAARKHFPNRDAADMWMVHHGKR